jgi:hypothetical protein
MAVALRWHKKLALHPSSYRTVHDLHAPHDISSRRVHRESRPVGVVSTRIKIFVKLDAEQSKIIDVVKV